MTRDEIQALIPHRDPFLWIDEVVELTAERIRARKHVDDGLEVFRGHYPLLPLLPGVLQCEAAFQAGAVLIASLGEIPAGRVPVVTRLNNVQFRRAVRPGQTLDVEIELTERLANAYFFRGKVSAEGKTCTRLEFACAAADSENL